MRNKPRGASPLTRQRLTQTPRAWPIQSKPPRGAFTPRARHRRTLRHQRRLARFLPGTLTRAPLSSSCLRIGTTTAPRPTRHFCYKRDNWSLCEVAVISRRKITAKNLRCKGNPADFGHLCAMRPRKSARLPVFPQPVTGASTGSCADHSGMRTRMLRCLLSGWPGRFTISGNCPLSRLSGKRSRNAASEGFLMPRRSS